MVFCVITQGRGQWFTDNRTGMNWDELGGTVNLPPGMWHFPPFCLSSSALLPLLLLLFFFLFICSKWVQTWGSRTHWSHRWKRNMTKRRVSPWSSGCVCFLKHREVNIRHHKPEESHSGRCREMNAPWPRGVHFLQHVSREEAALLKGGNKYIKRNHDVSATCSHKVEKSWGVNNQLKITRRSLHLDYHRQNKKPTFCSWNSSCLLLLFSFSCSFSLWTRTSLSDRQHTMSRDPADVIKVLKSTEYTYCIYSYQAAVSGTDRGFLRVTFHSRRKILFDFSEEISIKTKEQLYSSKQRVFLVDCRGDSPL